jgi:hypothetical protein
MDCKVDVVEPWTLGFELSLLLRPQVGTKTVVVQENSFLTAFLCCRLQGSVCLLSSISLTSDTVLCLPSQMRARCGECPTSTGAPIELRHTHANTHTHCNGVILPLHFYLFTNFFLAQKDSIALECQYSSVNITAFGSFCPKKSYHVWGCCNQGHLLQVC